MAEIIRFPVDEFAEQKPLQIIELTPAERDVVTLVFDDGALLNPVRPSITTAVASIDREIARLTPLTGGIPGSQVIPKRFGLPGGGGPGSVTNTQISALINSLNSLKTSILDYQTHSDRVSGFTLPPAANPPSFTGLIGVATAHNLIKNSLEPEGTPEQDFFSFIFQTLLGSAEILMNQALIASFRIFERLNGGLDNNITLTLSGVAGNFIVGETVNDLTTVETALVSKWEPTTNTLTITQSNAGEFNATDSIQGVTSGATATIVTVTLPTFDARNPAATPQSSYTSIVKAVNVLIGPINSLPSIDDTNYFEALDFITKFGLAQTMSGLAKADLYSRFLFVNVNGTEQFKEEIVQLLEEEEEVVEATSLPLIGLEGESIPQ